jgi:acetyl-CoA carboxylase carboxyltransferase component
MNEKIEIEVKYSTDDYTRGMIFSQRKNSSQKYIFLIALISGLIAAVGVYYFIHRDEISWDSDLLLKFLFF